MLSTLTDIKVKIQELLVQKSRGGMLLEHEGTRDKITRSRVKNFSTHARYIAEALGRDSTDAVRSVELTDENLAVLSQYLRSQGKGEDTVANARSSFKFARAMAIESGVPIFSEPKVERFKRHRLYQRGAKGSYEPITKVIREGASDSYGLPFRDWPRSLAMEYENEILPFFTDETADRHHDNILAPETMALRLNRFERAFGIELHRGQTLDQLEFRKLATASVMKVHRKFLYGRSGEKDTESTRGYLDQFRSLALHYYEDETEAKAISAFMRKCKFKTIKRKDLLVRDVHADDLYRIFTMLVSNARHYEANIKRKHGRSHVEAQAAAHWMRAGIWGTTLVTMLRQKNIAGLTIHNFSKQQDGVWSYSFSAAEMKGKRARTYDVIDLWLGDEGQSLLSYVLDKVVEVRPHLVAKFRELNPGEPDPVAFFLNEDGRPVSRNGLRFFFPTTSMAYLGPEKRVSMHAIRTIMASWLFVREGAAFVDTLRLQLHHKNANVTMKYYVQVEDVFGARLAKARIDEQKKHRKTIEAFVTGVDRLASNMNRFEARIAVALDRLESLSDNLPSAGKASEPANGPGRDDLTEQIAHLLGVDATAERVESLARLFVTTRHDR